MADKRIIDLDPIVTVQPTTLLVVVDNPTTAPVDKKATVNQLPIADAQLTPNVPLLNAPNNAFTGAMAMNGSLSVGSALSVVGSATLHDAALTVPLPVASGGTGMKFFTPAGPTAARTYNFPDANATMLTNVAPVTVPQGGTGTTSLTSSGVLLGRGTGAVVAVPSAALGLPLLARGGGADPVFVAPSANATASGGASISGAGNMLGLQRSLTFTATGKVFVMFVGAVTGGSSSNMSYRICWGTGAPPVSMQGPTGSPIGMETVFSPNSAIWSPMCIATYWFGYAVGSTYWFDLQLNQNPGGGTYACNCNAILIEVL